MSFVRFEPIEERAKLIPYEIAPLRVVRKFPLDELPLRAQVSMVLYKIGDQLTAIWHSEQFISQFFERTLTAIEDAPC